MASEADIMKGKFKELKKEEKAEFKLFATKVKGKIDDHVE